MPAEMDGDLFPQFREPAAKYRSLLFWAWNSRLEEEELIRQIGEMRRAGVGGFFMHSRDGLETVYMGDEWKRMIRSSVLEARKQGLEAWLYDEDRWPSGTAGGAVPARWGDDSRCKGLTIEVLDPGSALPDDKALAVYGACVREMELCSLRRLKLGELPEERESLLVARLEVSGKSDWFNGEAPPDNLNPAGVRHFLEATHEEYKAVCGDFFGTTVPGIFTDEPSLHDRHASFPANRGWIPWTTGFGEYFWERRGYDPLDTIPYLYFNGKLSAKIRHDYWRTVTERYAETYSGEIAKWCEANGIAYTGHFLQEDKLGLSARVNGGIMPHYRYQGVPGIDILCEATDEYLTVKQCTSVAHQYGKRVVLSESYGCTGWEFSFEGQKWVGDWQYALGVTRLVKHMALYTLKGCGKRDYPPSFNYNTTWWDYARPMEDYQGRIASVLMEGVPIRDVVVLHPASTAWARLGCDPYGNPVRNRERDVSAINEYGYTLNSFLSLLSGIHYDYDLGDESLMARDGKVQDRSLLIARAAYQLLILPPVDTLLQSTLRLLGEFLDAGGTVLAVRPLPFMVEGEVREEATVFFRRTNLVIADDFMQVEKILEARLKRRVSIIGPDGRQDSSILYLLEDRGNAYSLFLANNDRCKAHRIAVSLWVKISGQVRRLDPLSGGEYPADTAGGLISETMGPADSRLYIIEKETPETLEPEDLAGHFPPISGDVFYTSFSPECKVTRNMPNALTLDSCRWRFEDETESEEMEVWQAQEQIREALGMIQISHNGIVQRYKWVHEPHAADGKSTSFVFRFTSTAPLEGLALALEDAKDYRVLLNGREIPNQAPSSGAAESPGWFLDRSFERVALPPLKTGENRLDLICAYKNRMQVEDSYLIGDFSVDRRRRLTPEDTGIRTGDWTLQGYPHYAGSLTYTWDFVHSYDGDARIILKVEDFSAVTLRLRVNEHRYDIPWKAAASLDITAALLLNEKNRIAVELVGSPRNLLGPFHAAEGKLENTNDGSFRTGGMKHIEGYNFYPYGLFAPPKLYLRQS
jgi:hypothetical protein